MIKLNSYVPILVFLSIQLEFMFNMVEATGSSTVTGSVDMVTDPDSGNGPIPKAFKWQIPARQLGLYISLGVFGSSLLFFGLSFICWRCNLCCTRVGDVIDHLMTGKQK